MRLGEWSQVHYLIEVGFLEVAVDVVVKRRNGSNCQE